MPISGTVYATIFILDFVAHWNDFMWPMLVVTGEDMRTIQLAIQTWIKANTLWRYHGIPDHIGNPHAADVRISSEILRGRYCIHWHKGIAESWRRRGAAAYIISILSLMVFQILCAIIVL